MEHRGRTHSQPHVCEYRNPVQIPAQETAFLPEEKRVSRTCSRRARTPSSPRALACVVVSAPRTVCPRHHVSARPPLRLGVCARCKSLWEFARFADMVCRNRTLRAGFPKFVARIRRVCGPEIVRSANKVLAQFASVVSSVLKRRAGLS
eukprot:2678886-Rhodomonas_salina.2